MSPRSLSAAAARSRAPRLPTCRRGSHSASASTLTSRASTVVDIDGNSPAARFGFQPRDIVREVNGEEIDTVEKLKQVAEAPSRWWRFTVERDGKLLRQTLRY